METIGQRIARLRGAKNWSRPELGRRMAQALGREEAFSGEVVRLYETDKNRPGKDARRALASVFDKSETYIEFGSPTAPKAEQPQAVYEARSAREEMLLDLFRGLTPEQQREATLKLLAQVEANRSIQKHLEGPLRTFSNEQVAAAYGTTPVPAKERPKRPPKARRESGPEMGDFLDE